MTASLGCRQVVPADTPALAGILMSKDFNKRYRPNLTWSQAEATVRAYLEDFQNGVPRMYYDMLTVDDKPAGFMIARENRRGIWTLQIGFDAEFRGMGYGRQALDRAFARRDRLKNKMCKATAHIENLASQRLLRKYLPIRSRAADIPNSYLFRN